MADGQVHPYQVKLPRIGPNANDRNAGISGNSSRLLPPLPNQKQNNQGGMMVGRSQ